MVKTTYYNFGLKRKKSKTADLKLWFLNKVRWASGFLLKCYVLALTRNFGIWQLFCFFSRSTVAALAPSRWGKSVSVNILHINVKKLKRGKSNDMFGDVQLVEITKI